MFGLFSWGEANCELHKRILIFLSTDSSRTSSLVGKPSQTVPPDGNGASLSKNEIGIEDYRKQQKTTKTTLKESGYKNFSQWANY